MTYRQLDERSNRRPAVPAAGLNAGDTSPSCIDNHPRYYELLWAAQRSGCGSPPSSKLTAGEVEYIVDDCGAKVLRRLPRRWPRWPPRSPAGSPA